MNSFSSKLGLYLNTSRKAKILEIIVLFVLVFLFIKIFESKKGNHLLVNQTVLWLANIFMLCYAYLGVKLRNERFSDYGLSFKKFSLKFARKTFLKSIVVFIIATLMFFIGSMIMVNITGIPENTDLTQHNYLKDNLWVLPLTLISVYISSSFGEEVIYRAFLINRLSQIGMSPNLSVMISAVIFGLIHYDWGPMGIVQTAFMGLALGFAYNYFNKKIWIVILAHMYMDTVLFIMLYLK